jgi:hypothetical protein
MAKGKHATALFEVICTGKNPPRSSSTGRISTPKWWFKGHTKPAAGPAMSIAPAEPPPRIVERIIEQPVIAKEPVPMRIAREKPVALDPANGEISFKLSYAGAAAAGFILLVLVAIAYMAGTRATQIGQAENFQRANNRVGDNTVIPKEGFLAAVGPEPVVLPAVVPTPTPEVKSVAPPAAVVPAVTADNSTRQVGLNYVIFQSYPDTTVAQRAMDFLNKAGFPCTIEHLPGWSWSSVVSTKGFEHIQNNPELKDYLARVQTIAEAFAGKRQFNHIDPHLKKWRAEQQIQ